MILTLRNRMALMLLGSCGLMGISVLWWQQRATGALGEAPVMTVQWDQQLADARQIDVNRAAATELERLPQIGPSLAGRIVAYRNTHGPFQQPQDMANVQGIGPKTLETLRPYLRISNDPTP